MYADSDEEEVIRWLREGYQEDITQVADMSAMPEEFVKLSVYDKKHREVAAIRRLFFSCRRAAVVYLFCFIFATLIIFTFTGKS